MVTGLFSMGKRIKKVAEDAMEVIDDGLARLAGHNTASYLKLRVGQKEVSNGTFSGGGGGFGRNWGANPGQKALQASKNIKR